MKNVIYKLTRYIYENKKEEFNVIIKINVHAFNFEHKYYEFFCSFICWYSVKYYQFKYKDQNLILHSLSENFVRLFDI